MKKEKFDNIQNLIETFPGEKKEIGMKLLDEIIFMSAELTKLKDIIKEKGWTEQYKNGANQYGIKKCTEGEIYNVLIKNYRSIIMALLDLMDDTSEERPDELVKWLNDNERL